MQSKTTNNPLIDKPSSNHSLWIIVIAILSLFLAHITGVQAQSNDQSKFEQYAPLKSF